MDFLCKRLSLLDLSGVDISQTHVCYYSDGTARVIVFVRSTVEGVRYSLAAVVAISLVDRLNRPVRSRSHLMVDIGAILGVVRLSGIWRTCALVFGYSFPVPLFLIILCLGLWVAVIRVGDLMFYIAASALLAASAAMIYLSDMEIFSLRLAIRW